MIFGLGHIGLFVLLQFWTVPRLKGNYFVLRTTFYSGNVRHHFSGCCHAGCSKAFSLPSDTARIGDENVITLNRTSTGGVWKAFFCGNAGYKSNSVYGSVEIGIGKICKIGNSSYRVINVIFEIYSIS